MKMLPPLIPMRLADDLTSVDPELNDRSILDDVSVFLNPFQQSISIRTETPVQITIYDLVGNLVERLEITQGELIAGESLRQGMYLLVISNESGKKTIPIIKSE